MRRRMLVVVAGSWIAGGCGGKEVTPAAPVPADTRPAPVTAEPPRPVVPPRLVATVDVMPGLQISIHAATIFGGAPSWTFVTHGMAALDRPELVLSIAMRPDDVAEQYPEEAVTFLGSLAYTARARDPMHAWEGLTLGAPQLGRHGMVLVPAIGPSHLELPDGALTILLLTEEEDAVANDYGAARIAALLGNHHRAYPTAWWLDRDRPSVVSRAQVTATRLAGLPSIRSAGVTFMLVASSSPAPEDDPGHPGLQQGFVALRGATLHVRVNPDSVGPLVTMLGRVKSGGVLLLTEPDPMAGARMVWQPGKPEPAAITGPGLASTVTGSFLVISIDAAGDGTGPLEDGAVLYLTPADRDAVVAALEAGTTYRGGRPPGMSWQIEVAGSLPARRRLLAVVFETPIDELGRLLPTQELELFLLGAERELIDVLADQHLPVHDAVLHLTLRPGKRVAEIEIERAGRGPWIDALLGRLARLPPVTVTGEVELRVRLDVGP